MTGRAGLDVHWSVVMELKFEEEFAQIPKHNMAVESALAI